VIRLTFGLGERLAAGRRRLARRRSLLAAGCDGLEVERGERILAACPDYNGGYALVATSWALYCSGEPGCWSRLRWERVTRVAWDGEACCFVITALSGTGRARLVVPARARGVLPELAAERITHSYLGRWSVPRGDGQDVLVEARRQPGTGKLLWVILDGDHGRGAELAIARLAAEFGVIYRPRSGDTAREAE
jgi:hypothetical protein